MSASKDRTFTIQGSDIGFVGGVYRASSPYSAGKKAARQLFRAIAYGVKYNEDPKANEKYAKFAKFARFHKERTIKLLMRETTRDSEKRSFYYDAIQTVLPTPKVVVRNGVEITIEKEITIKTCRDSLSALKI